MQLETSSTSPHQRDLLEVVQTSLETMAFVCCEPVELPGDCPGEPMYVRMGFAGAQSGTVEMIAPERFARSVAANLLCCDVDDREAVERGEDTLREIINVVVGALMPRLAHSPRDEFNLTIPSSKRFEETEWGTFASDPLTQVVDADGETLAFRLTLK